MRLTGKKLKKMVRKELVEVLKEQDEDPHVGFENLPPGWDGDSVEDFAEDFVGQTEEEGFFSACMEQAEGEDWLEDEPEKFCASLKDELHGEDWRGED